MQRKKILWLVSWYPNKNDAFDGDFIQRHARAAAIYHDIHVVYVTERVMAKEIEEEWNYATGLTEQLVYFKSAGGLLAKLKKQMKWKKLFRKAIEDYVGKNGLPQHVHVHVPWKSGLLGLWMKAKYGTSYIVSEHWGIYNDSVRDSINNRSGLVRDLLKSIYRETARLVVVSHYLGNDIEKAMGKKPDSIIPNVVDTTIFHTQAEKYSKFSFIHVSNMAGLKNTGLILKAFSRLISSVQTEAQLIMIGNRNDEYVRLANQLGLLNRNVFFRGEVPYTVVAEEMRLSHCFVLFSDSETFSCVTAEALCCGIPVIASEVGALPELVDRDNGRLVEPKNIEKLAEAMQEVLEHYNLYEGRAISKKAAEKYGYSAVAEKFKELYGS